MHRIRNFALSRGGLMKRRARAGLILLIAMGVSGCAMFETAEGPQERQEEEALALDDFDPIDDTNLSEFMMSGADPDEAVAYFRRATQERPGRIDLERGLATSLMRARQQSEGVSAWRRVVGMSGATSSDRVSYADAQIRTDDWEGAAATLAELPGGYESFERHRLEALLADSNENWDRADQHYEAAVEMSDEPSGVLNNWGYSKLTRGEPEEAERLFREALSADPGMFAAKNNLAMALGAQENYSLPMIEMTQEERARLTHTLALTALRQNDLSTAQRLLQDAIDTHPRHFDEAVRALRILEEA